MIKNLVFFVLLLSSFAGYSQSSAFQTQIPLTDTVLNEGLRRINLSYEIANFKNTSSLSDCFVDSDNFSYFKVSVNSIINVGIDSNFHDLYFKLEKNKKQLRMGTKVSDSSCVVFAPQLISNLDTITLCFNSKSDAQLPFKQDIAVLFDPENDIIRFRSYGIKTGLFELDGREHRVFVSPIIMNTFIMVDTCIMANISKNLLLGELFPLENYTCVFSDFNFAQPSIQITCQKADDNVYFGIEKGQFLTDSLLKRLVEAEIDLQKCEHTVFFFTGAWCPNCPREYPIVKQLAKDFSKDDLQIIIVGTYSDYSNAEKEFNYLKKKKLPGKYVIESVFSQNGIAGLFQVSSFPSYVVLNKNNSVVYRSVDDKKVEVSAFLRKN